MSRSSRSRRSSSPKEAMVPSPDGRRFADKRKFRHNLGALPKGCQGGALRLFFRGLAPPPVRIGQDALAALLQERRAFRRVGKVSEILGPQGGEQSEAHGDWGARVADDGE